MHLCGDGDLAFSRFIRLTKIIRAIDDTARREVGSFDDIHQIVEFDMRIIDHRDSAVDNFGEIMGGDVRRETHCDTRCAVDEQVRKSTGQHIGFFQGIVEIQAVGNGIFFKIAEHLLRDGSETRLGITHRSRAIAVDRAEIAVPVNETFAHIERLRESDQSVVNGGVAVGMIFAKAFAYDPGTFFMRLIV